MKLDDMTLEQFDNCCKRLYDLAKERCGHDSSKWLTFREAGRKLRINLDDVESLVDGLDGLDMIVGFRVGNGVTDIKNRGDYLIEVYE